MTEQFVSAAQLMAQVLGAEGYGFVTIEHPISSASAQQLHDRAVFAVNASAEILLSPEQFKSVNEANS